MRSDELKAYLTVVLVPSPDLDTDCESVYPYWQNGPEYPGGHEHALHCAFIRPPFLQAAAHTEHVGPVGAAVDVVGAAVLVVGAAVDVVGAAVDVVGAAVLVVVVNPSCEVSKMDVVPVLVVGSAVDVVGAAVLPAVVNPSCEVSKMDIVSVLVVEAAVDVVGASADVVGAAVLAAVVDPSCEVSDVACGAPSVEPNCRAASFRTPRAFSWIVSHFC